MAMIPAAATRESVRVDFPARQETCWLAKPLGIVLQLMHISGRIIQSGKRSELCRFSLKEHTMIHMSNDTHVSDVVLLVHELTDLVDRAAQKATSLAIAISNSKLACS